MRVRWTTDAADDLKRICDCIAESHPEFARGVAHSLVGRIATLETFPHLGRPGRVEGTREIAFPPLPFVGIYEGRDEQIIVLRVLHGAQIQQGDFFSFKGSQVAPTATMFLRTEPSLLDQFIAALPTLDASDGGQAVLQCVPLPDDA